MTWVSDTDDTDDDSDSEDDSSNDNHTYSPMNWFT